ncbi:hypothetical protein ACMD2_25747 [Ananas comosus]|uniref:Neprosin PEP catalytic domain-containing protein n=1 Tax=Ananas comosus TaxID=4615 RepID=A0A199V940_ANACO|nr:hypothetical protein ACMD2_25747 [Ananas comosus]
MDHNKGKHSDGGAPGMVVLHKGGVTGNSVSWKTRVELKQSPTTARQQFLNYKDPHTGDWWLYREDLAMPQVIGYWPKSLFTTLADSATLIRWGGFVTYSQRETGPPMGSGHYPDELEQKAAYIKNIELFNSDGKSCDLIDGMQSAYTDARKCYKVSALVDSSKFGLHDGFLFYFGGPPGILWSMLRTSSLFGK